jgi:putative transposase
MPRKPRSYSVQPGFFVLKTWRGHNKEWNIHLPADRQRYLRFLHQELAKQSNVVIALVLMANHVHEIFWIQDPLGFSKLMRNHHARYGAHFNKLHGRCGKVAQDRPHTTQLQDERAAMTATFYVLANPLRAGVCKDLRNYRFCSYHFFAFGQRPRGMPFLQYPEWYLALGQTPGIRQRIFRSLFFDYLKSTGVVSRHLSHLYFLGSPLWIAERKLQGKALSRNKIAKPPG